MIFYMPQTLIVNIFSRSRFMLSLIFIETGSKHANHAKNHFYVNRQHFQSFSTPTPAPVDKVHAPKVKSWAATVPLLASVEVIKRLKVTRV